MGVGVGGEGVGNCTGGARFRILKFGEDFSGGYWRDWRLGNWGESCPEKGKKGEIAIEGLLYYGNY